MSDQVDPDLPAAEESAARPTGLLRRVLPDTRPLAIPAFRRIFLSGIATTIGSAVTAVAVQQQIYDITGSSAWVGISSAVALVPLVALGLFGGAIADTYNRRTVLMVSAIGIAVTSLGLWLCAFLSSESVWVVMALLAVQQGLFAVNQPTRSAILPTIVSRELVPSANALSMSVFSIGVIVGPVLAGALIPVAGLPWLYFLDAATLVFALYAIIRLPSMPAARTIAAAGRAKVSDGLRYLRVRPLLLMTFVVDLIAMIFGMPRALFPQMAEHTFGGPPGGGVALGWLNAALAVGALLGGLTGGWVHRVRRQGLAILLAVVVWGLAMAAFGLTSALWLAVLFLALGGWADLISAVYRSSLLQLEATDEMRGRLQGVFTVVVAGGPRLADLAHGLVASATSASFAVTGGGIACVVLVILAGWWGRSLRTYDTSRHRSAAD